MKYLVHFLLAISVLLWGCKSDESPVQPAGKAYFPLNVGAYQIYNVEKTEYTAIDQSEFSAFEMKAEIVDSFTDLEGSTTFVIHRSTRESDVDSWEFIDAWSARVDQFHAVVTEGTTPFVRIAFPVAKNTTWNGNTFNSLAEDTYSCLGKGESFDLEGITFPNCLIVSQEDYIAFDRKDVRKEVYALNIGLIYKEYAVLNYCVADPCFGQLIVVNGIEYIQTLKEYGQN